MKRQVCKGALVVAICLGIWIPPSTAQNVLFDQTYSTGPGVSVASDSVGNVYVAGGADSFLLKYNAVGTLQWQKGFGPTGNEGPGGIAVDSDGNVYMSQLSPGNEFTLLTKFDSSGTLIWHRRWLIRSYNGEPSFVAVDAAGNIFVTGSGFQVAPAHNWSTALAKFDTNGNLIWQRGWGPFANAPNGVAVGPAGDVYFIFYHFLVKYDSAGNLVWQLNVDPSGITALAVDPSGNILASIFGGSNYPGLLKFDSGGNLIWQTGWTSFSQAPVGVATNNLGAIYVGTHEANTELLRFDSSGNLTWRQSYSGAVQAQISGLASDSFGRVYATGTIDTSSRTMSPLPNNILVTSVSVSAATNVSYDIFAPVDSPPVTVIDGTGTSTFIAPFSLFLLALQDDNTPLGNGTIQPIDSTTGTTPVSLTFSNVTQGGITSLTTSGTGQPPPSGFRLGNPPIYYELSTTALFSGPVMVCINYSGISVHHESNLGLFHSSGGGWTNVTTSLDTANNIICGSVSSLSPFAVFEAVYAASVQQPINADGSSVFNSNKGVIPVKFTLSLGGPPTCNLPPATISVVRTAGTVLGVVDESVYTGTADAGSNFRISGCQYVYNLLSKSLGTGTYRVDISIGGDIVGQAIFALI